MKKLHPKKVQQTNIKKCKCEFFQDISSFRDFLFIFLKFTSKKKYLVFLKHTLSIGIRHGGLDEN